jgi:hypothetical protein
MVNWKLRGSDCGQIEVLPQKLPGGTKDKHEEPQNGRFFHGDSNLRPSEHKAEALTITPICRVFRR